MKILLTGANGAVGANLLLALNKTHHEVVPFGFNTSAPVIRNLDLTDFNVTRIVFRQQKPQIVIHLAGIKNVFICEKNKSLSNLLNYKVTENITSICKAINSKLIFISSDYVFDGKSYPFYENTKCSPTTQYGQDKCESENFIKSHLNDYVIVRTSGIFGHQDDYVKTVLKNLKSQNSFEAFHNLYNNPTFVSNFNEMIKTILLKGLNGIFHCSGSETVSRYEFAKHIAECFGLKKELIKPKALDFAVDPRPPRLEMNCQKTYQMLNYYPAELKELLMKNRDIWEK